MSRRKRRHLHLARSFQLAMYTATAFLVFVLQAALMVGLGVVFTQRTTGRWASELAFQSVLVALTITGLMVLSALFMQTQLQFLRRKEDASLQKRIEHWSEIWYSLIWNEGPAQPTLDGLTPTEDPAAGKALLSLRENLSGSESERVMHLYDQAELLEQDLSLIYSRRTAVRLEALEHLAMARHPRSIYHLERLAGDPHEEVARYALLALARVSARVEQPPLAFVQRFVPRLARLDHLGDGLVQQVLVLLEHNAAPVLEAMLEPGSTHPRVRAALEALGKLRQVGTVDLALPWLTHPELSIRVSAARAFAKVGSIPQAAHGLIFQALQDPEWPMRAQAALAAAWLPDRRTETALLNLLGDANWWVRHNAGVALAHRGKRGRTLLHYATELHPDRFARDTARQILLEHGEMALGAAHAVGN